MSDNRDVEFLHFYFGGLDDEDVDLDRIDPDEWTEIPVNRCPEKVLNAFAVRVESTPTFLNQAGLERPSVVVDTPEDCFLVWFHNPLDPSVMTERDGVKKPSRYNLWLMIRHLYAFHLGGMEVDVMGNPLLCRAEWLTATPHHLAAMKAKLIKAGQWNSSRPPQFFTKGGALQTPAQVRARKEAFAAALEQRQAKSLDRARRRLKAAEACSHEQLAEAMGCSVDSVPRLLRRAEQQVADAEKVVKIHIRRPGPPREPTDADLDRLARDVGF